MRFWQTTLPTSPVTEGLVALLLAAAPLGCQKSSQISKGTDSTISQPISAAGPNPQVQGTSGIEPDVTTPQGKGEPIELPDTWGLAKSHFQTRSLVQLPIKSDDLQAGDTIELRQKDADQIIGNAAIPKEFSVLQGLPAPRLFFEQEGFSLGTVPEQGETIGYGLMVRLIPRILISRGKLRYGSNPLLLMLSTDMGSREASHPVVLRDFPYFTLGTAHFATQDPVQRTATYQGRMAWQTSPVVRAAQVDLSSGLIGITHR